MNQIIFFENIDKTTPYNLLVKNVYNKSVKMSNLSKISSSNSVDDTMEHRKEGVKLKIKSCGWWIVKRKEINREIYLEHHCLDIVIFPQKLFNWFSIFQSPHAQWRIKKEKMTATIVLLALISIVFVGYVDRFSLTNLYLGVVF